MSAHALLKIETSPEQCDIRADLNFFSEWQNCLRKKYLEIEINQKSKSMKINLKSKKVRCPSLKQIHIKMNIFPLYDPGAVE